jgi:hypothetical protein
MAVLTDDSRSRLRGSALIGLLAMARPSAGLIGAALEFRGPRR